MVPVLNACNIAAAVYGNHDFGKYLIILLTQCIKIQLQVHRLQHVMLHRIKLQTVLT